jgi:hypothetical protein
VPSTAIRSLDLREGDIVDYHGDLHRVTHVDCHDGWAWPIAFDDAGWAIAVGPDLVVVQRAAAHTPHPLGPG